MAINWSNLGSGALAGAGIGSSFGPFGTAIGGGLGALASLFGGDDNPTDDAMKFLDQIPEQLRPYFEPYIKAGQAQLPGLTKSYGDLTNDPGSVYSRLGAGYKESPGFQWKLKQGEKEINNAAARGGMLGTNQHQQNAGELAENLAMQDFRDYMNQVMGLYGTGLTGEQHLADQGLTAGKDYSEDLASILGLKGKYAYEGGAQKNQNINSLLANLITFLNKRQ